VRAIQVDRYGGPEVLVRREIPVPSAKAGEALVRVTHAGINFMDIHTRQGKYATSRTYPMRLPVTLGMEGAGVVETVAEGVEEVRPRDRVAWCIVRGTFADYAAVPSWRLVKVPDAIPLEMAAAVVFHGSTAHYLAEDVARLAPGMTCLVLAASGGIGQLLVQLAKQRGARVIAVTSTPAKAAVAKARGADEAILYDGGRFAEQVRWATAGEGVHVVFDPVGRETLRESFAATRKRGLVVNFGAVSGPLRDLDPIELGEAGSLFLTRPRLADHMADAPSIRRRADSLFRGLRDGTLRVEIAARYRFERVAEGLATLEERRVVGKPILEVAPA